MLTQNLIITISNQKARDLQKRSTNRFDKIISLDNFISEVFEKISFLSFINPYIAKEVIYKSIQSNNLEYFSYIAKNGTGLDLILDFLIKVERNEFSIELFHSGAKCEALKTIQNDYSTFKKTNNLADISDIEKEVLEYLEKTNLEEYDGVFVDSFLQDGILFAKSSLQDKIIKLLQTKYQHLAQNETKPTNCTLYEPSQKPFDVIDEVKLALKFARKLLLDDENLTQNDICFVASNIALYAPLFRNLSTLFGVKVYDSLGIALGSFSHKSNMPNHILDKFNQIETNAKAIQLEGKKYGFELDVTLIKSNMVENTFVLEEKIGLELTEANQLATIEKQYKHIIFVGVDMNNFPPKSSDNFLYTNDQNCEYFFGNNYFESSLFQYNALKRISENLYILHPNYKEKRQIHRSIIVNEKIERTFEADGIEEERKKVEDLEYLASLTSEEFSKYDGLDVDGIKAENLSASQLGSYAKCPLKYLYTNKLKLKTPKNDSEGFEVSQEGTLMHSCFESFAKRVQGDKTLTFGEMSKIMLEVLEDEYQKFLADPQNEIDEENIYHHAFKTTLARGLDARNETKGLLVKFVELYDKEKESLEYFANSEFEKEFALDSELKPYKLKDKTDMGYFIKGYIDRLDNLSNTINIIDYKSKKVDGVSQKN